MGYNHITKPQGDEKTPPQQKVDPPELLSYLYPDKTKEK
jgi:hypothetical protein